MQRRYPPHHHYHHQPRLPMLRDHGYLLLPPTPPQMLLLPPLPPTPLRQPPRPPAAVESQLETAPARHAGVHVMGLRDYYRY